LFSAEVVWFAVLNSRAGIMYGNHQAIDQKIFYMICTWGHRMLPQSGCHTATLPQSQHSPAISTRNPLLEIPTDIRLLAEELQMEGAA